MKKTMMIPWLLLMSFNAWGAELKWDLLRTLKMDPQTHKTTPSKELQNILGKDASIKGYMIPLDYSAKQIIEFLFMPYIPTCSCVPPPPPNQMILVKMKKGITMQPSYYPYEVTGRLSIKDNKDLQSSFQMEGLSIQEIKK